MKVFPMKTVKLFAVSLLFATAAQADCCKSASECPVKGNVEAFLEGAAAGAVAGVSVDLVKQYVLPVLPSVNVNTTLSNDQLTGLTKASVAAFGSALVAKLSSGDLVQLGSRLAGVIVGAIGGAYVQQLVANQFSSSAQQ